jgi:hypothetical protein
MVPLRNCESFAKGLFAAMMAPSLENLWKTNFLSDQKGSGPTCFGAACLLP